MITTNKLKDPNLSEQDQDVIIGAFVRQRENNLLRKRWEIKLKNEYDLPVPKANAGKRVMIRRLTLTILTIAASALLIFVLWPGFAGPSGNELLAGYLEEGTIQTYRSAALNNRIDSMRVAFQTEFVGGDYSAAVALGEEITGLTAVTTKDHYNLGLAQLKAGENTDAIATLRSLQSTPGDLATEINFYLALALLQEQRQTEAFDLLNSIEESDGLILFNKAKELLNGDWD